MYRKTLIIIGSSALLFAILVWTQYSTSKRAHQEYASLEKSMTADFEAWQGQEPASKDPRPGWQKRWSEFVTKYPTSEPSAKAHFWILSLMKSMYDTGGLADYLKVAVRYPDNPVTPTILNESVLLHLQKYGPASTGKQLTKIAKSSRNREHQAAAHAMMAYLEDDDSRKIEALQRFLVSYGDTKAAAEARTALEELRLVGIGAPAPPFEFTDLYGKKIVLQDLRGKWVLLDFWATWCAPCAFEIPEMKAIFARFRDNNKFAMLGISLDYDKETLLARLKKEQIGWPQYVDGKGWESKLIKLYRVTIIPNTYLIDPEGRIRYKHMSGAQLKKILGEKLG